jgi:hypothetical protein
VSSTAGRAVASGRPPPPERSCGAWPSQQVSADGSLHISCGTPTPSKWLAKAVPLVVIQRQLGHSNLGITSVYLQGIDNAEIIDTVHTRRAPTRSHAGWSSGATRVSTIGRLGLRRGDHRRSRDHFHPRC